MTDRQRFDAAHRALTKLLIRSGRSPESASLEADNLIRKELPLREKADRVVDSRGTP